MSDKSASLSGKESLGTLDATITTSLQPDIENGSVQNQVGDTQLLEQIASRVHAMVDLIICYLCNGSFGLRYLIRLPKMSGAN